MRTPHDVIKNMVRTEKGSNLLIQNKYFFKVSQDANKIDIKRSVESIYKVHVKSVNIISVKGKKTAGSFTSGDDFRMEESDSDAKTRKQNRGNVIWE